MRHAPRAVIARDSCGDAVRSAMWVKVCGMTDEQAVAAALAAGVDAIGFVFAPSVRQIAPARARQLAQPARGKAACVAVFLQPAVETLEQVLRDFAPDLVQLDHESLTEPAIAAALHGRAVLPVLRDGRALPTRLPARALFEGTQSGTGRTADWNAARALASRMELLLAGGLNPDNVAAAIAAVRPFGVDVSSGVEAAPGVKSSDKIFEFVRAARDAAREF